jgi:hypothetical protein
MAGYRVIFKLLYFLKNEKQYVVLSPCSLSQGKNYTTVLSFEAQQNRTRGAV